jgi:quercetin dioxygenase-like cupin family protein
MATQQQPTDLPPIVREHLLTAELGTRVERIEAHRVRLPPGQRTGVHSHPGGVVGYVEDGVITFQVEGEDPTVLRAGSVFYEPPGAVIRHFDNASAEESATFVAFYPLSGDQPFISMLR